VPGGVPMVLGVGSGFLTMVSCYDGRTWREGRAVPGGNCANDGDCSHDPGRALGLAYSNGWFVAPFGNEGNDTQIRRTQDGLTWERVYDRSTGGMAVGKGRIVANSRPALYSDNDGATWTEGAWRRIQKQNSVAAPLLAQGSAWVSIAREGTRPHHVFRLDSAVCAPLLAQILAARGAPDPLRDRRQQQPGCAATDAPSFR